MPLTFVYMSFIFYWHILSLPVPLPGDRDTFCHREFSFTLEDDVYVRYQSFDSQESLEEGIRKATPYKMDIGAIFSIRVSVHFLSWCKPHLSLHFPSSSREMGVVILDFMHIRKSPILLHPELCHCPPSTSPALPTQRFNYSLL